MSQSVPGPIGPNPERFRRDLLGFYDLGHRAMPWRETRDPYAILVSELMLQQTQVQTVIPYFLRFLALYPNPAALAAAPEAELLKVWEGLGYYRRARNLQAAAIQICEEFDGSFPREKAQIDRLRGVGPYTSAAVASIAFNQVYAAVDGNVIRVLSRVFASDEDVASTRESKLIAVRAQSLISPDRPGDYNQALMELGATVCTPRQPSCLTCPLNRHCRTYQNQEDPHLRPVKKKKAPPTKLNLESLLLFHGDQLLMAQRPETGLMAGMWELPSLSQDPFLGWSHLLVGPHNHWGDLGELVHRFTHIHATYRVTAYLGSAQTALAQAAFAYPQTRWLSVEDLKEIPVTGVFAKLWPSIRPYLGGSIPCPSNSFNLPGT